MHPLIIISVLFLLFYVYSARQRPLYLNVNIKGACQQADKDIEKEVPLERSPVEDAHVEDAYEEEPYEEPAKCNYYEGDDGLTARMHDMGMRSKQSFVNQMRRNVDSMRPYFEEELNTAENSVWWEVDNAE